MQETERHAAILIKEYAAFVILDPSEDIPGHAKSFLVQDEKTGTGQWEFPGGKGNLDEREHVGAARELKEELGVSVVILPKDLLYADTVEGASPHRFLVFVKRVPGMRLEQLRTEPKITRVDLFDERQLVGLLKENRILPKHAPALREFLVSRSILLR